MITLGVYDDRSIVQDHDSEGKQARNSKYTTRKARASSKERNTGTERRAYTNMTVQFQH